MPFKLQRENACVSYRSANSSWREPGKGRLKNGFPDAAVLIPRLAAARRKFVNGSTAASIPKLAWRVRLNTHKMIAAGLGGMTPAAARQAMKGTLSLMTPMSVRAAEEFSRVRLSQSFFMRDFLFSEIAAIERMSNLPDDPKLAIQTGRSVSGMVRPSVLAVLRLSTVSYLVGACTGRSAGFSPLRMRST
jgi:hypothetical protein